MQYAFFAYILCSRGESIWLVMAVFFIKLKIQFYEFFLTGCSFSKEHYFVFLEVGEK